MSAVAGFHRPLILGGGGQLAGEFRRLVAGATCLDRGQADLTRDGALRDALTRLAPDLVINCAAYNLVDQAEREPAAAFAANALGPGHLAAVCRGLGATLVHVSTDMVFGLDGARAFPYGEEDLPGPVNAYGASKLAGEHLVAARGGDHLIVRTCGLYGRLGGATRKASFVDRILARAQSGEALRVVGDQFCTPSAAADVAAGILELLAAGARGRAHLTNAGQCSWHEFAMAILETAGVPAEVQAIDTADWPGEARRSPYTVLRAGVREQLGLPPMPDWRDALARFLAAGTGRPAVAD